MCSKVIQLYTCIYSFFRFFFLLDYYKIVIIVLYADGSSFR